MRGPRVKQRPADEPIEFIADDDDREPTKEEIMEDFHQRLGDVLAGEEGIPAREGLEALRRRIYDHADREPAKEEIVDDIRQGLRDAQAGCAGQDAMDFLNELEHETPE